MAAEGVTSSLHEVRRRTARTLLGLYKAANAGHIGASLSCLEILLDLLIRRAAPGDQLVLSKGHAAAALYTSLAAAGRLDPALLPTFYRDGTILAAHPPCGRQLPDAIPFGTGSLGHGLSLATGLALSQRFTGKKFNVFAVVSDGDLNEGSTWEAALFAAQHGLERLTVVVDRNHLQGFGSTEDVIGLEPLADKWRAFGFEVAIAARGNDFDSLDDAHRRLTTPGRPRCVVAETIKGHGVSFMQNKMEWHYLPMTDAQYAQALADTDAHA
jgi:transketolase